MARRADTALTIVGGVRRSPTQALTSTSDWRKHTEK